MASQVVYDAIRSHLETNWSATELVFENERWPGASDGLHWAYVEMSGTYYGRESIGADSADGDRWDEEGDLWVHLMMPSGVGTRVARGHLKNMADIFRGTTIATAGGGSLEFMDAKIGFGESVAQSSSNDGNWYRLIMTIEWRSIDA